jgi:ABC-type branched-subunit amino acid transport system ATPase component
VSNLIEVTGVSKSYGGVHALSLCDLEVREGEINGLIGPNGSGKTTLFNVITGYERIQQGAVRFRGAEITNAPPDRVFGLGIGRTFQLTRLFMRLTVLENMLVATQRPEGWLRAVLRRAGSATEKRRAMELLEFVGIARLAHEPAGNLSYGQRKLLELASLLVADPTVLLLDEPAGGVNPTLIGHLADRIAQLNRAGKTILVVEHNMEFVMSLCSRVTVLSQGTALVSGTPREVRADPAVLDAYLGGEDDPSTQLRLVSEPARAEPATPPRASRITVVPATSTPDGESPILLRLRGVTAGYGGGDILKEVSLDVPRGGITCVVGPNGAGKSTLLAPTAGSSARAAGRSSSTALTSPASPPSRSWPAGSRRSPRPTASSRT